MIRKELEALGYRLGAKHSRHRLTGRTIELYAKHPTAHRPRWQRLVSLTLPQPALEALAAFLTTQEPTP